MKVLFLVIIIAVVISLFFTSSESNLKDDVNTIRETDKSERCAKKGEEYSFSYSERFRQTLKGCF